MLLAPTARFRLASALFVLLLLTARAHAAPVVGFVENFPGTSTSSWGGGAVLVNPGADGIDGPSDGFLHVSLPVADRLGTMSQGTEYAGNWLAAGVDRVTLWLSDVDDPQPLEIHFAIGNSINFWQYNIGFVPPSGTWGQFTVNLSSSANFTRIIGSGTFTSALQSVDRILLRHDKAPFIQTPDLMLGEFGVDGLTLTSNATPALASSWGRIKALYR